MQEGTKQTSVLRYLTEAGESEGKKSLGDYKPLGLEKGLKIIEKSKKQSAKYVVYFDPDVDGLFSGKISEDFLTEYTQGQGVIERRINKDRAHGIYLGEAELKEYKGATLICVDFSISKEQLRYLVEKGINVVVLDHHNIEGEEVWYEEKEGVEGVVLNNQYKFEDKRFKFLSGAGMAYVFFREVSNQVGLDWYYPDGEALVGITLLSDVREIENEYAKEILTKTYKQNTAYFKYLEKIVINPKYRRYKDFGEQRMHRNFIDFTFSPHLNALFRLNKGEDAIGLIMQEPKVIRDYCEGGLLYTYRTMQQGVVKELMEATQGYELSNLIVKWLFIENKSKYRPVKITNFTGLVCSKEKSRGKTSIILVYNQYGYVERGSVRGLKDGLDYLELLTKYNIPCAGHSSAFGVKYGNLSDVDWAGLNAEIRQKEGEHKETRKVVEVGNFSLFLKGAQAREVAEHNALVRDRHRVLLRYVGEGIQKKEEGKVVRYYIDGVEVLSFSPELTPKTGLIVLVSGNQGYRDCTLTEEIADSK